MRRKFSMKRPTRKQIVYGGIAALLAYLGLSIAYGDQISPLHNAVGEAFQDFGLAIGEGVVNSALWMAENDFWAGILLVTLLWGLKELIVGIRKGRIKLPSLPAFNKRRVGIRSGIGFGLIAVLVGLSFVSVALADHGRPMVTSAYASSEDWVNRQLDAAPWNDDEQTTTATGDTQTDAPTGTETDDPADTRADAPTDTETDAPADNRRDNPTGDTGTDTTVDTRTDTTPDKPVTDALSGVLADADRIVTDPVKFVDQEPLRAALWALAILVLLMWRVIVWRRNVVIRRELRTLHSYATTDSTLIDSLQERVTKLEPKGGNRGDTQLMPKV